MTVQIRRDPADRMIELYCEWRNQCAWVQASYERFLAASRSDRRALFAAYTAALDQEQAACGLYAEQVRLVASLLAAGMLPARRGRY